LDWQKRYLQQAAWTSELRAYLFGKAGYSKARAVLEVGCGTGAVLCDGLRPGNDRFPRAALHGVDLSPDALAQCQINVPGAFLTRADALHLPYSDNAFDITYCHLLLLWVSDPLPALMEMKRVTRSHGYVLALAEPDYSARVVRPRELSWLGEKQTESLKKQGADVNIGSRLANLFDGADIHIHETGVIKRSDDKSPSFEEWENEWEVLEDDLADTVQKEEIHQMKQLDEQAWRRGDHVFYVPTYFAWGQV
jgi:ubiquinone/menaquinone biosynthesis C-methylase UbiE